MHVIIIVPFLDEKKLIDRWADSLALALDHAAGRDSFDVVLADNGSTDGTGDELHRVRSRLRRCVVVDVATRGVGLARAAAVAEGLRLADRRGVAATDTWIVSIDADGQVPPDWCERWSAELRVGGAGVIAGCARFPPLFDVDFPLSSAMLSLTTRLRTAIEAELGVTNPDGFQLVIDRETYVRTGGFQQPRWSAPDGSSHPAAGEDWDLGLTARMLDLPVRRRAEPLVTVSPRRLIADPVAFFLGRAYDAAFRPVSTSHGRDLTAAEFESIRLETLLRTVHHHAVKPLLLVPGLAERALHTGLLDPAAAAEFCAGLDKNRLAFRHDRERFIFEFLPAAAARFSPGLLARLSSREAGIAEALGQRNRERVEPVRQAHPRVDARQVGLDAGTVGEV